MKVDLDGEADRLLEDERPPRLTHGLSVGGTNGIAPIEERELILFRSYGAPAFEAVEQIITDASSKCFSIGGWQGLSAAFFKSYGHPALTSYAVRMEEAMAQDDEALFHSAFGEFVQSYDRMSAHAYHFLDVARRDDSFQWSLSRLQEWCTSHQSFLKEWKDLTRGKAHRSWLRELWDRQSLEGCKLLEGLANVVTPRDSGPTESAS